MKNLKHLFTVMLFMCCSIATAHDFEVDGIYYNITDEANKTVKVTYKGSWYDEYSYEYTGNVVIPETVVYNGNTYNVTSIGYEAFYDCSGLISITIPNSVRSIGDWAFRGCSGLKEVHISDLSAWCNIDFQNLDSNPLSYANNLYLNGELVTDLVIPDGVTEIKNCAFGSYSSLTSITIPNGVTSIGNCAFYWCTGLTSITIPNGVTSIGDGTFYGCSGLTSITIPNSVTSIGYSAFEGCSGLTSITIPNSVTSIGLGTFYQCSGLTSITIPNSVTSIGYSAFEGCSGLTSITIPNSVTSIGDWAFHGCSKLETIYIGKSIETIGDYAFAECDNITEIKVAMEKPIKAKLNIFNDCVYDNATLYIPNGIKYLYEKRQPWNQFLYIQEMDFTGIEDVKYEDVKVKCVYDLHGKKVENPINGIYIINGKKVFVK